MPTVSEPSPPSLLLDSSKRKALETMGNILSMSLNLDSLICCCWGCVSSHSNYLCQLQEDLAVLKSTWERLMEARDDVRRQVEMAEREQQQPLEQVRGWLSRVEALETQVNQLIADGSRELEQKCLGGGCPRDCRIRYRLGRRVAKMVEDVGELTREKPQGVVAERLPPPGLSERPIEETVGMDSRLDQALSSLHGEQVGILGLYGLGGVGKTTLLTQINNSFSKTTHDFDFVIWATVSRNVNLEKIQDDIWKKIGICDDQWKSKDRDEKATRIWNVLSRKRFVLLLDDVWERLNLTKAGVPLQNKKNKVVFTTRSEEVCGEMEADRKIKVECLSWNESWNLFQMKVGEDALSSHPEIPQLAQVVARECCGLPLVLTTVGRAMACKKTPQGWNYAITLLQSSAPKFPGMGERVLPLLKYSYDSLPSEVVKSCFLYCSLFPEDFEMDKSDLINFWICEGFLDEFDDNKGANAQGSNIIDTLICACLLEEMYDHNLVKLHDIIREMALWIACEARREKDKFLVESGRGLTEAPEIVRWMEPKRISLENNQIEQLTESPNCPNLVTLFLAGNHRLKMINDSFFQFMPNLRVLTLKGTGITELPLGISNLVLLQYMDLSATEIKALPVELKNLGELKYLKLSYMPQHFSIPKQLISSLSKLQLIYVSFPRISDRTILKDDLLFGENNEAFVNELDCLKCLHDLRVTVTTATAFGMILRSDKLRRCISHLFLLNFNTSSLLNVTSLTNMKHLYIAYSHLLETIESNFLNSKVCFHNLNSVGISECGRLKDLTWLVFAPKLEVLCLQSCDQMQELVSSRKYGESVENGENISPFPKLQRLLLLDLPLLTSIFWQALPFACLYEIIVRDCPLLKKLPLNANNAKGNQIIISGETEWWNELEWEDEDTRNAFLPCFYLDEDN